MCKCTQRWCLRVQTDRWERERERERTYASLRVPLSAARCLSRSLTHALLLHHLATHHLMTLKYWNVDQADSSHLHMEQKKKEVKIVQFSGGPELNIPLKWAFFFRTPGRSNDWCTLERWIWKMAWWNTANTQGGYVDRLVRLTLCLRATQRTQSINQPIFHFKWWIN